MVGCGEWVEPGEGREEGRLSISRLYTDHRTPCRASLRGLMGGLVGVLKSFLFPSTQGLSGGVEQFETLPRYSAKNFLPTVVNKSEPECKTWIATNFEHCV